MKRGLNIHINFTNRAIYTFITLVVLILAGAIVFAFGTSTPSTFGHSAGELDLSSGVSGNAIFNDNVGIGTPNPQVKLDVNGEVRIGNTGLACTSNIEGSQRYNSVDKIMEYCDGASWTEFSAGGEPVAYEGFATDANTLLLLHFNGAHGSTFFKDDGKDRTVNPEGDTKIVTDISKVSGSAGFFDGIGDLLSVPDSPDWDFGNKDFTIEFWVYFSDVSDTTQGFLTNSVAGEQDNAWAFTWNGPKIEFYDHADTIVVTAPWNPDAKRWYHVALVRSGNVWTIYKDGISIGSATNALTVSTSPHPLHIGRSTSWGALPRVWRTGPNDYNLIGYLDEFRISNIARYTSNFVPAE